MLDDLRDQADDAVFLEDGDEFSEADQGFPGQALFFGMTPVQRLIISVMLLMMVCILSTFCLLVTEKIALPFF
ncbi:MAG: hypothetical protein H8D34_08075 [Chloroflexi bacterium]|nr:hypothetical protein [Chloroflexota bacterium]